MYHFINPYPNRMCISDAWTKFISRCLLAQVFTSVAPYNKGTHCTITYGNEYSFHPNGRAIAYTPNCSFPVLTYSHANSWHWPVYCMYCTCMYTVHTCVHTCIVQWYLLLHECVLCEGSLCLWKEGRDGCWHSVLLGVVAKSMDDVTFIGIMVEFSINLLRMQNLFFNLK